MSDLDVFRFELGSSKDDGDQQLVAGSGMPGEEFKDLHRIGFHGLGYNAPAGSHAVGMALSGRRDRASILGVEHKDHRQKNIPVGGSVLYDAAGNVIRMFNDHVRIGAQENPVSIKCSSLTIEFAGGTVVFDSSGIKHNGKKIDDSHVHIETGLITEPPNP